MPVLVFFVVFLAVTGLLTAILFAAPTLVVAGYFFLIIPGLILSLIPSVFLYALLFFSGWVGFRRQHTAQSVAAGLAAVLLFVLVLPQSFNRHTDNLLAEAAARDLNPPAPLSIAQNATIAIEAPYGDSRGANCDDLCRLLLFNRNAARVVPLRPLKSPKDWEPAAFRLDSSPGCALSEGVLESFARDTRFQWTKSGPAIAQAVRWRIASGDCLVREPVSSEAPALIIRRVGRLPYPDSHRLSLGPSAVRFDALELEAGGRLVARTSSLYTHFYTLPLHLEPYGYALQMYGWEWGRRRLPETDLDNIAALKKFTNLDLELPPIPSPEEIRDALDKSLDDPSATNAEFLLVSDYYQLLSRVGFRPGDEERLVRLASDDRASALSFFRNNLEKREALALRLRDPLLLRLARLARTAPKANLYDLQEIVLRLPEAAFREPVPALDYLLSRAEVRRRCLRLIPRLAEQGPPGAIKLAAIVRAGWQAPDDDDRTWGKDAEAALDGLCRMGPAAADLLPALRLMEFEKILPPVQTQSDRWRGTLVSLGADPEDFYSDNYRKDPSRYHQHLRNWARSCKKQHR